ncbi:MAG: hypothetical protein AB7F89_28005, partial [Pirellulaceae bacterium]
CSVIPKGAARQAQCVLAEGEITGHSHRVDDPRAAALYEHHGQLYLHVTAEEAVVVHEEHGPIALQRGRYRVWRQREFNPMRFAPADRPFRWADEASTSWVRD